jgi:hypothetical protein
MVEGGSVSAATNRLASAATTRRPGAPSFVRRWRSGAGAGAARCPAAPPGRSGATLTASQRSNTPGQLRGAWVEAKEAAAAGDEAAAARLPALREEYNLAFVFSDSLMKHHLGVGKSGDGDDE